MASFTCDHSPQPEGGIRAMAASISLRSAYVPHRRSQFDGRPTTICFLCQQVLEVGNEMVSHGLCHGCFPALVGASAGASNGERR
jgi:hypothetical protein